jgi:hypothetical protein
MSVYVKLIARSSRSQVVFQSNSDVTGRYLSRVSWDDEAKGELIDKRRKRGMHSGKG